MNLYQIHIDAYAILLESSGIFANKFAAAYISFSGKSREIYLKELEDKNLMINDKLTDESIKLAELFCLPEKTIVAVHSDFGKVPLCIFCLKNNSWGLIKIDYNSQYVTIVSSIDNSCIISVVEDALIGKQALTNYSPFSLMMTNDEANIFNLVLMFIGDKAKAKSGPLFPHDFRFNFEEIVLNKNFARIALIEEVTNHSTEIINFIKDPERIKNAINGLIDKQILTKSSVKDFLEPSFNIFNFLAPQKNMSILSYMDIASKKGYKYYLFDNSILEITLNRDSITFTSVKDLNYSFWQ